MIHHPDRQVLLRHQSQLLNILNMVGLRLNEAKSELEPVQDIKFLGLPLSWIRGELPSHYPKLRRYGTRMPDILPENFVVQRSVPIYGITQLGLRSHPTGSSTLEALTTLSFIRSKNRFSTPRRTDPVVLATLLRHWQNLSFLTSGIPI